MLLKVVKHILKVLIPHITEVIILLHQRKSQKIKYDLIIQSLYLKPGSTFNVTNTEQTQAHLLTLKVLQAG